MEITSLLKNPEQKKAVLNIAQALFAAQIQTHIIHLEAKKKSYAEHIALNEFYDALGGLADELVEKTQGKYGIITGYSNMAISSGVDAIPYINRLLTLVETNRKALVDGYIQQLTDNVIEQIASTLYKLNNLH